MRIYRIELHGKCLCHCSFSEYISADCARDILIEDGYSPYIKVTEVK